MGETLSFCNQDFRCVFLNIRHYQFIADAELEKSGNLGTRFLVHFRPKFGKSTRIRKVDENSESSQKFGKLILKIRKKFGNLSKIRKVCPENSEKFGKFGKIRKVCPETSENFGK